MSTVFDRDLRPALRRIAHANNARLEDDRYNQRALVESVNSSIKRSSREIIGSRCWFRQFREFVLVASGLNVNQTIAP